MHERGRPGGLASPHITTSTNCEASSLPSSIVTGSACISSLAAGAAGMGVTRAAEPGACPFFIFWSQWAVVADCGAPGHGRLSSRTLTFDRAPQREQKVVSPTPHRTCLVSDAGTHGLRRIIPGSAAAVLHAVQMKPRPRGTTTCPSWTGCTLLLFTRRTGRVRCLFRLTGAASAAGILLETRFTRAAYLAT